jgi:Bax protein
MKPLLLLIFSLLIAACTPPSDESDHPKTRINRDINLPDFSVYNDVNEKKAAFFGYLLPLIEQANLDVMAEREELMAMAKRQPLNNQDKKRLTELVLKYKVDESLPPNEKIQILLNQINAVPASLVLAQAANESAWGTSRFAVEGNNLFGQWCFSKGCGLVPEARGADANHEVATFTTPFRSVASYIRNLNRHPSYQELREKRNQLLADQGYATGEQLAEGLMHYSERGEEYVNEIQAMIRHNKLNRYDPKNPES